MKQRIMGLLAGTDWTIIKDQDNIKMIQIMNGNTKINIYWGTMTLTVIKEGGTINYHGRTLEQVRILLGIKKPSFMKRLFNKIK